MSKPGIFSRGSKKFDLSQPTTTFDTDVRLLIDFHLKTFFLQRGLKKRQKLLRLCVTSTIFSCFWFFSTPKHFKFFRLNTFKKPPEIKEYRLKSKAMWFRGKKVGDFSLIFQRVAYFYTLISYEDMPQSLRTPFLLQSLCTSILLNGWLIDWVRGYASKSAHFKNWYFPEINRPNPANSSPPMGLWITLRIEKKVKTESRMVF